MGVCLWCGKDAGEGNPCCVGGGKTRGLSTTGEGSFTKSYCYADVLTVMKLEEKMGLRASKLTKDFELIKPDIKAWYKGLSMKVSS